MVGGCNLVKTGVQNRFLVVYFRRSVQIKSGGAFSS